MRDYVRALLAPIARKNSWQLAEQAGHPTPDGLRHLLSRARWNPDDIRDDLQTFVAERLSRPDGVLGQGPSSSPIGTPTSSASRPGPRTRARARRPWTPDHGRPGHRGGAAGAAGLAVGAALAVRGLVAVTVRGASMEPEYHDGDRVLVRRVAHPATGQVVVVERPVPGIGWPEPPVPRGAGAPALTGREWLIKRVAAVPGERVPREGIPALAHAVEDVVPPGRLVLLGDNRSISFDSRRVGYFPAERVLGTVLRRLPR